MFVTHCKLAFLLTVLCIVNVNLLYLERLSDIWLKKWARFKNLLEVMGEVAEVGGHLVIGYGLGRVEGFQEQINEALAFSKGRTPRCQFVTY